VFELEPEVELELELGVTVELELELWLAFDGVLDDEFEGVPETLFEEVFKEAVALPVVLGLTVETVTAFAAIVAVEVTVRLWTA
jgi:hypothetical protein